ncbi:SGNH/GDSL hydrolase family protein [Burkholderia cenocepacia]|uniref:SGNH/GDSL hydrolase family protein n=1 Tax=Burkholderia cenocepacia TaxID=95486 RepID=UPI002AB68CD8|nr:SGNH/GDSL hydrolase family protein [Burkholderia cenocepacia]
MIANNDRLTLRGNMRVAIIGGSNSVIANGYIGRFSSHLSAISGNEVTLDNISVGGTTSLTSIGRLQEITEVPDVVVLEYSLNDTGHLNHRPDGAELKHLFLEIFFNAAAERFPNATIVPLILSAQPFYRTDIQNQIYDAEIAWYRDRGISYVDTRSWFFDTFGWPIPSFVYSDEAHYHRGCTVAMIGTLLAERVNALWQRGPRLGELARPISLSDTRTRVKPRFISAKEISGKIGVENKLRRIENRLVQADCISLATDERLALPISGIPIALSFASTNAHWYVELELDGRSVALSTRYRDIPEAKFIYTSIPLLMENSPYRLPTKPRTESIALQTKRTPPSGQIFTFDGFNDASQELRSENQLDLAGILILEAEK